jgi:hypothetical protein
MALRQGAVPLVFVQLQSRGVDAIPHPGGLWTILKDVPEVRVAAAALYFRPSHSMACVVLRLDRLFARRSIETGPPGA